MRWVTTAPLILSHWYGSLSLGRTKTISTTCLLQKCQSHQFPLWVFVCGCCADEWGCVCQPLCRGKKKKKELSGSLWDKCDYWVTCEEMAWTPSDCWPIVEQSHVSLFKVTLCVLCANVSKFFVHEHMSTWKHFSPAQNAHRPHVHRSVDVFPQNSGHASTVWQLHPKGRTNVFTRELFYCERRPYNTDCS